MGRAHGREDRPGHRDGAARRAAGLLARRLGRRPHHRPGRAVPRPPRRRPDLLQPGRAVRPGAADLLPVRAVGRRRRVHPGVLRRRDHGRGQRLDVPRLARAWPRWWSASRSRSRRWAARGCTPPSPAAATTSRSTTPTPSSRRALYFSYLPTCWREHAADVRGRGAGRAARPPTWCPTDESHAVRHARRRSTGWSTPTRFFEVKPLFAPELIVGFGRLDGRPVGIVANNSRCSGGVLFVDSADKAARFIWLLRRLQHPAAVPGRRARLHDRHARSSGRASSGTAPR